MRAVWLICWLAVAVCFVRVPGATAAAEFANGADVSWLAQMEATGHRFLDRQGRPADCLQTLKDLGVNAVRLRVFVNPSSDPRSGHCSPAETVAAAVRAQKMGLRVMIDFHYSDTWADPGHQTKPAAWAAHSPAQLAGDVYAHTRDVLAALKAQGVTPEWVQIGNEITHGMLWPEGKPDVGKNLADFINAGYRATKEIDPRIKVIVHLDRGSRNDVYRGFFDRLIRNGASFDVIGMSYYPWWTKADYTKTIDALGQNLNDMAVRYQKDVLIAEIGGEASRPANTCAMLAAALQRLRAVPDGRGLGVFYWEPEGAQSWSRYPLSAWGADGRPTEALEAFSER